MTISMANIRYSLHLQYPRVIPSRRDSMDPFNEPSNSVLTINISVACNIRVRTYIIIKERKQITKDE